MSDQAPWEKYKSNAQAMADGPWAKYNKFIPGGTQETQSDPHPFVHALAPTALSVGAGLLAPATLGASMALMGGAGAMGQGANEVIDRAMGWNPGDGAVPTATRIGIHGAASALMSPLDRFLINPLIKKLGIKLYGATIPSVIHEGDKFGKDEVSKELIEAGAWNPFSLPQKAQTAAGNLTDKRNDIFADAASKGARGSIQKAVDPTINKIFAMGDDPAKETAINQGAKWADKYLNMKNQSPTPRELSDLATSFDRNVASQGLFGIPKPGAQETIEKSIIKGLKDESINSTEAALPGKGLTVRELNARIGRLLSTLPSQKTASMAADRSAAGGATSAITNLALGNSGSAIDDLARTAAQSLSMPTGYAMVKSAGYPSILSNYATQLGAEAVNDKVNPWSLFRNKENTK